MSNSKGGVSGKFPEQKMSKNVVDCKCCKYHWPPVWRYIKSLGAPELGAAIVKEAVKRAGIPGEEVDELTFDPRLAGRDRSQRSQAGSSKWRSAR